MESLFSWSDLPLDPLMGHAGVIKIADLVLLPYISFIIAFTALECIETVQESIYRVSQIYPLPPAYGSNWVHKIADFFPFCFISPVFLLQLYNGFHIWGVYIASQDYPLTPFYGPSCGKK